MAVVLFFAAVLMCLTSLLDTPTLTRLTNAAANRMLDADVRIGRVELSLMHHLPFLRLEVDSVTVLSGPMKRLVPAERARAPQWADTLLTLTHFRGGVNLAALARGNVSLHDVIFDEPGINIVTVNDSVSNYLIFKASEDTAESTPMSLPAISIDRFSITRPHPLRYHNVQTSDHFTVALESVTLEGGENPTYKLHLGGDVHTPALSLYNLDGLDFGANGGLGWDPRKPTELELRDFDLTAAFLNAKVNAHVDFGHDIVVRDYDLNLGEMGITRILSVLPDSLRRAWNLEPEMFDTDLAVSFSARSTGEFNLTTDSLPHVDLMLRLTPGSLRYGDARLERVAGRVKASLRGNDLNAATFAVEDLTVAGPATTLTLDAVLTEIMHDPLVKGRLRGDVKLVKLPMVLARKLGGFLSGRVKADITFEGRQSMLSRNGFHRLRVDGDVDASKIYYLSNDTNLMAYVNDACLRFGTNSRVKTREGGLADSLLTASIKVDSANVLKDNISMVFTDFRLGAGASNRHASRDTTAVIPMGGMMELGKFYLTVIQDSVVFNMREAKGYVSMTRYKGAAHRPLFGADLSIRRISTGDPTSRFMVSRAQLHVTGYKKPKRKIPEAVKRTADSLQLARPDLSPDSVYRYALFKHRRHKGGYPRVHPELTETESEIINWGTSKTVRRLLLGWVIEGDLTAKRAGMFTPYFPIRNRVRNFNVHFNNDTVQLTDVKYKAGHSDFLLSGRITNLKRGFTSRGFRSPLKINFEVLSDTIDVNELANSTFMGAAYAAADTSAHAREVRREHPDLAALERAEAADDAAFEKEIGKYVQNAPDSMAPLLIPRNIDLRMDMKAKNVLYSDLVFKDFDGEALAYAGALNLHHLKARSDVGRIELSALYSAPTARDLKLGFGLKVNDFNLHKFTKLIPALDSVMPLLEGIKGIVNADVAATCDIDSGMNLVLPTLDAAIALQGDSLELIDSETYRKIGRWLLFKNKQRNIIDHMQVEATIRDGQMQFYPFMFDIDRYRLGVQGHNDLGLNFDYHIAVLKSPLPFKFGINLKGNPDDFKIRLGRARFKQNQVTRTVSIVDTARVNLLKQIENIFRRGVSGSRFAKVQIDRQPTAAEIDLSADTISAQDSLLFIREGLIPAPVPPQGTDSNTSGKRNKKTNKGKTKPEGIKPEEKGKKE